VPPTDVAVVSCCGRAKACALGSTDAVGAGALPAERSWPVVDETEGVDAASPSGFIAAPRVAVASALASTFDCGVPVVAAGLAVAVGSVAAAVPLVAVVAVLPWVAVVLRPVVFASPGLPAAAASASSAEVAVPAVAACGAAAVPAVEA
jgi:hypothetical protein